MDILLYAVFGVIGAGVGLAELMLLKKMLFSMTAGKYAGVPLVLLAKLLIYAAALTVTILFFKAFLVALGIGFGAGMVLGAFAVFLLQIKNQK